MEPYIERNQIINFEQGTWRTKKINISGTPVIKCIAYGLPEGLYILDNGVVQGTPTSYTNRSAFIVATNDYGSDSAIVNFEIEKIPNDISYTISPPYGYAKSTEYAFVSNAVESLPNSYQFKWNFGDGEYSQEYSPKHSYELPGTYYPTLDIHYNETLFMSITSKVDVHMLINESVYFDYVPPPCFSGHLNRHPFKLIFTSSVEGPHYIDLAAQYSRSYEHQSPVNKWSFLRPEWRFLDLDGNIIDHVTPNETKLYANEVGKLNHNGDGLFVGVTGFVEFYFVDDMHNFDLTVNDYPYSTVIATLRTSGIKAVTDSTNINENIPGYANSLATTATPYMTLLRVPDYLRISENGIRDYINPRWANAEQPIITYLNFKYPYPDPYRWEDGGQGIKLFSPESIFSHAFPISSGEVLPIELGVTNVNGFDFNPKPTEFKYEDDDGYRVGGYYKGSFRVDTVESLKSSVTGSTTIAVETLSAQFYNPTIWVSNPEAGMMTTAQYIRTPSMSAIATPNQEIAINTNFFMPIQTKVDFEKDPMALTGFHGIHSIAATQFPEYHAWALDSELNALYRLTTQGKMLCAILLNDMVSANNLGFLVDKQVSPCTMVLDSEQNIWITLHDTVSTLKLDRWGNFLFAINPYTAIEYSFPNSKPDVEDILYSQHSYYEEAPTYKRATSTPIYGSNINDQFGYSVSINGEGDIFAVSSPGDDANGINSGCVRVYSRSGNDITQLGNDIQGTTASGHSISLNVSGNVIAIGSPFEDSNGTSSGSVDIYSWDTSLSAWSPKGVSINGEAANDSFGTSVSINAVGDIVAIGAPYNDDIANDSGSVEVHQWTGTSWVQMGSDITALSARELLGVSVSINAVGDIVAIGAPTNNDEYGSVKIYKWDSLVSDWIQLGNDIISDNKEAQFGGSVSINDAGTIVAIGAHKDNNGYGSVSVYNWNGISWEQLGDDIVGEYENGSFGFAVSLNARGNAVAIGSSTYDGVGSVSIYRWMGIYLTDNSSHWSKYSHAGGIHQEIEKNSDDYWFGSSVSLNSVGDFVLIGSSQTKEPISGYTKGAAYLYTTELELTDGWISGLPQGLPNILNDIDIRPFVEPNFIDSDSEDNVWISYSNFLSGYVMKYNKDGNLLYSNSYPLCASPQHLVVDSKDNVWISVTNNIWDSKTCFLEKRSSNGNLLSSFGPIRGLNYVTLDLHENPWFTYSFSWIGSIDNNTGEIFTTDLSGTNEIVHAADWFDPNVNTDETALEGIACDMRNRIFVINSYENQIYVVDADTKKTIDRFYLNPQGFGYYIDNQQGKQYMMANIWNKSLQACGDWTGLRWFNKYKHKLPYFSDSTLIINLTGESRELSFPRRENYELFKKNENFKLADRIKDMVNVPTLAESRLLLDDVLPTLFGKYPYEHDQLGVLTFEKISNFLENNADIDTCEIQNIYSLADELGINMEKYNLSFPVSLKRIMDYISINQSRLFGAYSVQNDYFSEYNTQLELNLGTQIDSETYSISAGNRIIVKDKSLNKYKILETGLISGNNVYPLRDLMDYIGLEEYTINNFYEFYEYVPMYDDKQLEGVIDWNHPQTTLNRQLSTNKFWIEDESIVDMHISYDLYKGLGLI